MGTNRARGRSKHVPNPEAQRSGYDWFATADAHPDGLLSWDIKGELVADVVLHGLACGVAIQFGRSWDGHEVIVRVLDGDHRPSQRARDSVELEELLSRLLSRLRARIDETGPVLGREPGEDYKPGWSRKSD